MNRDDGAREMVLRDVQRDDVDLYVQMRCDPVMMAELGGPLPREGIEDKVARDVADAEAGRAWILVIVPDRAEPGAVAGTVVVWESGEDGEPFTEIGWMVLPEFQGRGLAKAAVRAVLRRCRDEGRWGPLHAFPAVTNGASNGLCRSLGFALLGQTVVEFSGRPLQVNHWIVDTEVATPPPAVRP